MLRTSSFLDDILAVKSHSNKIPLFLIGGPGMQVDLFKRHITRAIAMLRHEEAIASSLYDQ